MSASETLTLDASTAIKTALTTETSAPADPAQWQTATVSSLDEVEQLLDWTEREGYREQELTVLGPDTFLVRWR